MTGDQIRFLFICSDLHKSKDIKQQVVYGGIGNEKNKQQQFFYHTIKVHLVKD